MMTCRWRSFLCSVLLVATILAVLNTRRISASQNVASQPPSAPGRSWAAAKVARAASRARVEGHKTREFFLSAASRLGTPDPSSIADAIKDSAAATATHLYDALPSFREIFKSLREPSSVEPGELLSRLEQLVTQLERGMEAPASSPDQQASSTFHEQQPIATPGISFEDDDDGECDAADAEDMPVDDPSHQHLSHPPSSPRQPHQHLTKPEAGPIELLLDQKHRGLLQLLVVVLCLSHSICFLLGKLLGARQSSVAAAQRQAGAGLPPAAAAAAAAEQQVLHQQGAGLPEQDAPLACNQHQEPYEPAQEAPSSSSTSHSSVAGSATTPAAPTGASAAGKEQQAAGKQQQAAGAPVQTPALQLASPTSDAALTAALDAADAAAGIAAVDTASSSPAGSSRPHIEQHSSGVDPSGSIASSSNSQQGSNAAAPVPKPHAGSGDALEAAAAHAGSSYHTLQQGGDGNISCPDQGMHALVQHCFHDHQDAKITDPLLAQAVQEGKMLPVAYGKHVIHIHPAMCSTLGRAMIVCGYGMVTLGRGFSQLAGVVTGATAAMHSVTAAVSTAAEQVNKVNTALGRLSDRADSAERAARCGRCASFGFGVMVAAVFACALWRGRIWDVAAICAAAAGPAASDGWFSSLGVIGFQRQVTSSFRAISCYLEQLGLYMLAGMVSVRWVLPRVFSGQSAERLVLVDIVLLQMVVQAGLGSVLVSCLGGSWLLWGLLWETWCLLQVLLHQLQLPGWARMCVELQVALLLPAAAAWVPFQVRFRGLGEGWLMQAMVGS